MSDFRASDRLDRLARLGRRLQRLPRDMVWSARRNPALVVALFAAAISGSLFAAVLVEIHGTGGVAARVAHVASQQGHDERTTCEIQARGLPAVHLLTRVLFEVEPLLVPQAHQVLPAPLQKDVDALRKNIAAYVAIEGRQPSARRCPGSAGS